MGTRALGLRTRPCNGSPPLTSRSPGSRWGVPVSTGEAPLLTLTFTFVDDFAPPASKSLWFGVLGLFPVLGTAAGYVLADPLTAGLGWRGAFFLMVCGRGRGRGRRR